MCAVVYNLCTVPQHDAAYNHEIVAVAARTASSAEEFARKLGAKKCYDSYEKLGSDEDVGMF